MTHTPAPEYETIAEDLARFLAKEGIGQWSANGVYKSYSPPALYLGVLPDEAAYSIAVNVYSHDTADTAASDTASPEIRIQLRIKGDRNPRTARTIANKIYETLHKRTHYQLDNGVTVLRSRRILRYEERGESNLVYYRVDSYSFTVNPS